MLGEEALMDPEMAYATSATDEGHKQRRSRLRLITHGPAMLLSYVEVGSRADSGGRSSVVKLLR